MQSGTKECNPAAIVGDPVVKKKVKESLSTDYSNTASSPILCSAGGDHAITESAPRPAVPLHSASFIHSLVGRI